MAKQKRLTFVFEVVGDGGNYQDISGSLQSTAEAKKWIRDNVDKVEGKTLAIGSMTPAMTVKVKTTAKVTFE